ncbi:MAG: bifunctional DNA-formamidopyrimidine glycosylase/DNA-(apurinic or apyrimidinic site) lyase [Phycisphaerales bacterium]
MPELPEIEHLRRTLAARIVGARFEGASLHRADVLRSSRGRGARHALDAIALLDGAVVAAVERRGKQLAIVTDRAVLGVHLGMSGQLLVADDRVASPGSHVHFSAELRTARGTRLHLRLRDPRRFGGLWLHGSREALMAERWSALGPDALAIDLGRFRDLLRARRQVKGLLLDQRSVAGIGNIYADEALHRAGIHPGTIAARIAPEKAAALHAAIQQVLQLAVRAGGSTIRDYRSADGACGSFATDHLVYGRAGQPCATCTRTLRRTVVAGRTTVHCPRCQRPSRGELSTCGRSGQGQGPMAVARRRR